MEMNNKIAPDCVICKHVAMNGAEQPCCDCVRKIKNGFEQRDTPPTYKIKSNISFRIDIEDTAIFTESEIPYSEFKKAFDLVGEEIEKEVKALLGDYSSDVKFTLISANYKEV